MAIKSHKLQRFVIAAALASGLLSVGVAASAQTTAAPAATAITNATSVSTPTVDAKVQRQDQLAELNAGERRVEFVHFGMSF